MKVLVVGPATKRTKGGIASVIQGMKEDERLVRETGMAFYSSCYAGNPLFKVIYETWKMARFPAAVRDYDVVHIHTSINGSARRKMRYAEMAKKQGKRVILHIHSGNFISYYQSLPAEKRKKLQDALRSADCVIALSQSWQEALSKEIGLTNCVALPNGIAFHEYARKLKPFDQREVDFLFMGRLGIEKGTDNLLKALKRMKEEGRKIRCVLAGDGPVQDYSQWVKEAQMEDCVRFAGWVQGKEKEALLQNARILLLPSRHEGLPMSILEAMAFGEAVISTRVGGIPEAVEEGGSGILLEPDEEESLYRAMCRLSDEPELAERMARRGYEIVKQKFDLQQLHQKLIAIYRRVLGE